MEDFQFIIYIIIGAIYIISRAIKGNNKNQQPQKRPQQRPSQRPQQEAPKTFEDILAEFGKRMEEQAGGTVEEEPEVVQEAPKPRPKPVKNPFEMEGRNRQFADEESRRIYEEAIVRAEGADLEFAPDEKFHKASLKMGFSAYEKEKPENEFAKEIRNTLADPDGAKKAIILSEILNRKY